jgi:hypothetical protein
LSLVQPAISLRQLATLIAGLSSDNPGKTVPLVS